MIGFGIFLLLMAALNPKWLPVAGIGVLCIVIGVILAICGAMGRGVGGRRHYY